MGKLALFAGVGVLALGLALAPAATATTASETLAFGFPLSPGSETLSFQQFDDNGGLCTLESVTLELYAEEQAWVTGENDSDIGGSISLSLTGFVTGSGGGLSTSALLSVTEGPVSVDPSDGVPGSGPDFHDFGLVSDSGSDADFLTSGLAPFIGTGTIDIDIDGSGGFVISGVSDSSLTVSDFGTSGWARITYEYTCIPEPTTMLLVASGLGAVALRLRRRK